MTEAGMQQHDLYWNNKDDSNSQIFKGENDYILFRGRDSDNFVILI